MATDRKEAADQPHVVIQWQPGDAAIAVDQFHAMRVRREIVEQSAMADDHAVGKARRAARILEVGDVVGRGGRQRHIGRRMFRQRCPVHRLDPGKIRGLTSHIGKFGGEDQQSGIAARQLDAKLLDVGIAAAERCRQRQRHRPCAGIDSAEEQGGEFGAGLGDQRDALAGMNAGGDQPARGNQGIVAKLGERIGAHQRATRVVKIEATGAAGGVIERLAKGREIGEPAWTRLIRRGGRYQCRHARLILESLEIVCHHSLRLCRGASLVGHPQNEPFHALHGRSNSVPTVAQ